MRQHHNNTNALLVEIMIAVLFFSLCATVILQLLVGVREQSVRSGMATEAMIQARNTAEVLSLADDPAEVLQALEYESEDGTQWIYHASADYELQVTTWAEPTAAGQLLLARIQAVSLPEKDETSVLLTLETAHYQAEVE